MPTSYQIGDRVELRVTFRNAAGALADPTTATIMVRTPAGVESSNTPTKEAVGVYSHQLTLTQSGTYFYRGKGVGAVVAAAEGRFAVAASSFTNP